MYADHVPLIAEHAASSPAGLARVATFVLATIRMPFHRMPEAMADIDAKGAESPFLFGSKRVGYKFIQEHADRLHAGFLERRGDRAAVVAWFMQIPGLAVAKASFLAQLCGEDTACLDSHNMRLTGNKDGDFTKPKKPEKWSRQIDGYLAVADSHCNSAGWWDRWCEARADSHVSAQMISALHLECLPRNNPI